MTECRNHFEQAYSTLRPTEVDYTSQGLARPGLSSVSHRASAIPPSICYPLFQRGAEPQRWREPYESKEPESESYSADSPDSRFNLLRTRSGRTQSAIRGFHHAAQATPFLRSRKLHRSPPISKPSPLRLLAPVLRWDLKRHWDAANASFTNSLLPITAPSVK